MANHPCLCVGTFFSLILEGMPNSGKKRKGENANYAIMENLLKVMSPEFKWESDSDKSTVTSKLKSCKTYGDITPLTDKICIDSFDQLVKGDYPAALERMVAFTKKYMSNEKKDWLASALIELVNMDDLLGKNIFFATENGDGVLTDSLTDKVHYLEPLLLGIWHHIVVNCCDNTVGENIISSWYEEKADKHETAKFISDVGKNPKFQVKVEFLDTISQSDNDRDDNGQNEFCFRNGNEENSMGSSKTNNFFGKGSVQIANNIYNIGHVEHLD